VSALEKHAAFIAAMLATGPKSIAEISAATLREDIHLGTPGSHCTRQRCGNGARVSQLRADRALN